MTSLLETGVKSKLIHSLLLHLGREETITELTSFWNQRKILKLAEDLSKKFERVIVFSYLFSILIVINS